VVVGVLLILGGVLLIARILGGQGVIGHGRKTVGNVGGLGGRGRQKGHHVVRESVLTGLLRGRRVLCGNGRRGICLERMLLLGLLRHLCGRMMLRSLLV